VGAEVKPSEGSPKLKGFSFFHFYAWNSLLLVPINISSTRCPCPSPSPSPCSNSRRRKSPMNNTCNINQVNAGTPVSVRPHFLTAQVRGIYGCSSRSYLPHTFQSWVCGGGTRHVKLELLGLEEEIALILTWILIFEVL